MIDQETPAIEVEVRSHLLPLLFLRTALGIASDVVPACEAPPAVLVRSPAELTAVWEEFWAAELGRTAAPHRESVQGAGGVPAWNNLPGIDRLNRRVWRDWADARVEDLGRRALTVLGVGGDDPRRNALAEAGVRRLVVLPLVAAWSHVGEAGTVVVSVVTLENGQVPPVG